MTEHDPSHAPHDHDHGHDHGHSHDHFHGHDHGHDHGSDASDPFHVRPGATMNDDELNPANRALAEALRLSFVVLTGVMLIVLAVFLVSGTRNVDSNHVGVRLLRGKIYGEPGRQVLDAGGPYFWPPEPLGRFLFVPTTLQKVQLRQSFWQGLRPGEENRKPNELMSLADLVPGRDGSLLTGDQNIVHAHWMVEYQVQKADAARFLQTVGLASATPQILSQIPGGLTPAQRQERVDMYFADQLVRNAAERAVVHVVGQVSADDFLRSGIEEAAIRAAAQEALEGTGITVVRVILEQAMPPRILLEEFDRVSQAESEKAKQLETARQNAEKLLTAAAGGEYARLIAAIDAYEAAADAGDLPALQQADRSIAELLTADRGGEISNMIREAQSYRTRADKQVQAEATRFSRQLPNYKRNAPMAMRRLWQDALQEILTGDVETLYLPSDPSKKLHIEINRDPEIQKLRELEANQKRINPGSSNP